MRARLTVETGVAAPRVFEVDETGVIRLGRNRENTIVLHDRHASRTHAKIFARNGHWFIRDQGTTNGTRIDGTRIYRETALRDGQRIDIGDVRFLFSLDPSKEPTDQMRALPTLPEVVLPGLPAGDLGQPTVLQVDELTALYRFLNDSCAEVVPHRLVRLALEVVQRQTGADLAGFLGADDDPEFKVVYPAQATVDKQLSRQLTQKAHQTGRSVWLHSPVDPDVDSESLSNFHDAVCVPLRAGAAADPAAPPEPPLGTLHAYKSNGLFGEREVRFCEVLAWNLANSLGGLRARRALEADNSRLRDHAASAGDELVGSGRALAELRQRIQRLADSHSTVLVVGESGVGKELVALGLHRGSPRHKGPMVTVNCAAITASMPESELFGHVKGSFTGATRDHQGFFMQADMGTLFLDEIGELSLQIQAKILRALESKRFQPVGARCEVKADVRIIAATNRDLEQEVREGRFRKDLFYRLNVLSIEVPPLRAHPEDIPELVEHFLRRLAVEPRRRVALSPAALARLVNYTWPGNVRQLRSVLEAAVAMARPNGALEAGDLHLVGDAPAAQAPPDRLPTLNLKELVNRAIYEALEETGGNNTQAAKLLGIHRDTLIERLKRLREGGDDLE
jgi:DNA-binding NtrC family response regulator